MIVVRYVYWLREQYPAEGWVHREGTREFATRAEAEAWIARQNGQGSPLEEIQMEDQP